MNSLQDTVCLVTGSSKGIGHETAKALCAEGAKVIVHGRHPEQVEHVRAELGAFAAVAGDIGSATGTAHVIDQLGALPEIDVLVNNVGIFSTEDFFDITDEEWLRYFQINVLSTIRMCRALMKSMLARDTGRVINVSSECGFKPLPHMIHYSLTKTALLGLSRGLAEVSKGTGVTVNSLLPGPTWTAGIEEYFDKLAKDERKPLEQVIEDYFKAHEPTSLIQRFITVQEVAAGVVFLAKNGAVNGSSLRVEGGIIRTL